jgi:hypothetical protein
MKYMTRSSTKSGRENSYMGHDQDPSVPVLLATTGGQIMALYNISPNKGYAS